MPNWVKNIVTFHGEEKEIEKLKKFTSSEEYPFDFRKIIPMPDNIYHGDLGPEERERYGTNNWYDWSIANWGTKWNSHEAEWDNNVLVFETAWSTPEPIFKKLSELFPSILIAVKFADEDLGNNCGTMTFDRFESSIDINEDFNFACKVWGYDPDEIRAEMEEW